MTLPSIRTFSTAARAAPLVGLLLAAYCGAGSRAEPPPRTPEMAEFDTALIVAFDVSGSVDDARYRLQLEGIASALEDKSVVDTIVSGPRGSILVTLVAWSDGISQVLPWSVIRSREDASVIADRIRALPAIGGEFTCLGRMLDTLADGLVPEVRTRAARVVIDVSGDGPDNCSGEDAVDDAREATVAAGATVNGLPILEGDEQRPSLPWFRAPGAPVVRPFGGLGSANPEFGSLDAWYRDHVMGGPGAFVLPANGYADFGRAVRQKFIIEISRLSQMPVDGTDVLAAR